MQLLTTIVQKLDTRTEQLKGAYSEKYERTLHKLHETTEVASTVPKAVLDCVH